MMDRDVAEVLEAIQHHARPDEGAHARFEGRVRRWERRRRASPIALVIAIAGSAAAAVTGSLRSTSPQPADTPTVVSLLSGILTFDVPAGWSVREGPGQMTFVRDLPSGGQMEVFAWHLSDRRRRRGGERARLRAVPRDRAPGPLTHRPLADRPPRA